MPKRVYFRTILLLDGLRRFDGPAERARRRFVTHEAFSDMLELRRILGRVLGERSQALAGWFALPGVVALGVAADSRWSAARISAARVCSACWEEASRAPPGGVFMFMASFNQSIDQSQPC